MGHQWWGHQVMGADVQGSRLEYVGEARVNAPLRRVEELDARMATVAVAP